MKNNSVVINQKTFELLRKKFFTRLNKTETSKKYKTFFPSLKYYKFLSDGSKDAIDAIRINKECLFPEKRNPYWNAGIRVKGMINPHRSFFCIKNKYWNAEKTKCYNIICVHNNIAFDRAQRGLSDIVPAKILMAISEAG